MSANGITIHRQPIETVTTNGVELSLISAGDGTEVIRHKLAKDTRWAMEYQDSWTACEMIIMLSGTMSMLTEQGSILVCRGECISASPILQDTVFVALTDVEFMYISSQPVFHFYSHQPAEMMELAVAVEIKDGYTAEHCARIARLSMLVSEYMGLSSNDMLRLNFGSFLHDIGKVKIPDYILKKPGKLTTEEWLVMRQHTDYGAVMLKGSQISVLQAASDIVMYHHERWDGKGYHGLSGEEIPVGACVVAVVDSYDAMTTDRVYQQRRTKDLALKEILSCRERMYRPDVVDAFIEIQDKLD